MPKGKAMRRPNGKGSVVKLSGKRRQPFEVRVNTRMDERNYPVYDVLGRFEDRDKALAALLEYTRSPYDLRIDSMTFTEIYEMWFNYKYVKGKKKYSNSSISCTKGAYKKCAALHNRIFKDIRTPDMQAILDNHDLSHAYMEHIQILFKQMYKYALQFDYITKDYAAFTRITKDDDDKHGIPFTYDDIGKLWQHVSDPFVDSVLILIYSGWRISELLKMPIADINTQDMTFKGGIKTTAGKNRIVPIHSKIQPLVANRLNDGYNTLFGALGKPIDNSAAYYEYFNQALEIARIDTSHTPHDCRHTFATLLDNAGANQVSIKRLLGHSTGNDITEKIYTHKDIEQLRKAIELI